jgi:hypothetical protein
MSGAFALLVFYLLHPFGFSNLSNIALLGYGVISVLAQSGPHRLYGGSFVNFK